MLDMAWEGGVTSLDTAPGYGLAEERIGEWSRLRKRSPTVVTKLPSLSQIPDSHVDSAIRSMITQSASALHASSPIACYLTHDAADHQRIAVRDSLSAAVRDGVIKRFGPSVYASDEILEAIASGPPSILQLPLSALDQRMLDSSALDECRKSGVRVFARSIFLQGMMLMAPDKIPPNMSGLRDAVTAFQNLALKSGTSAASLALRFVRDIPGISSVVVGAYSSDQLSELLSAVKGKRLDDETVHEVREIAGAISEELLDPRRWSH